MEEKHEEVKLPNHYATLGISFNASTEDIRKAAKSKRVEVHPDKCIKHDMSEVEKAKIHEISVSVGQAADVLMDGKQKKKYDREWTIVYGLAGLHLGKL